MADDSPEAAAAPPAPAPVESLEGRIAAAIARWRDAHIAGGPIARATDCWNQLQAALAHLAASLTKEF
jgi:hypothetical protein